MNINDFFNAHSAGHIADIARQAGTTLPYLQQCKYGRRRMSADLAVWLEHATGGELTARELRPDLPWPDPATPARDPV